MAAPKNFVTGFNHNIKHKGKVYHVQTEDSGVDAAHIITHLFVGGNILASKKTSYADIKQADNLKEVVRELMEEQHKEMLRNLIGGAYDELDAAHSAAAKSFAPGQIAVGDHEVQLSAGVPGSSPVSDMQHVIPASPSASAPPAGPGTAAARAAAALSPAREVGRQATPEIPGDTVFGEDLISEKSLDEVILAYLSGDGEEPK